MDFTADRIRQRLVENLGAPARTDSHPEAAANEPIDLAPLLAIADDASFIRESYQKILGRECDVGGFVHYRELLRSHFPRRNVILQLVESAEAKAAGHLFVGLWDRHQEATALPGARLLASLRLALWHRARRLFEFFLRVSRIEAVELKLDYLLQEISLQSQRQLSKLDHTLFLISDKIDRYVADLGVKQAELSAIALETRQQLRHLAASTQAESAKLQALLAQQAQQHQAESAKLQALLAQQAQQHQAESAKLQALLATSEQSLIQAIQATHVVQIAATAALQSEIQPLAPALVAIGARQRPPIFQAGPQVLVTEIDGFLLGLPSAEWRLGAYYALRGLPEPGLTRLFASLVQPGHIVVDAGAHIGIYSLYALRHLQGHGRLYSFEPTPATFALLRDNIQVNGFLESGVVHLDPRALSDRAALAPFTAFPANSGHNTLFPTGQPGESLEVQTVSLDEALAHEPRVDLVKIDAEGAEPLILRGMAALLARNPQIRVFVEFAPSHLRRAGLEPLQWFEDLQALGLLVQRVDDLTGELHPIDPAALANCFSWNLLLTRIQS